MGSSSRVESKRSALASSSTSDVTSRNALRWLFEYDGQCGMLVHYESNPRSDDSNCSGAGADLGHCSGHGARIEHRARSRPWAWPGTRPGTRSRTRPGTQAGTRPGTRSWTRPRTQAGTRSRTWSTITRILLEVRIAVTDQRGRRFFPRKHEHTFDLRVVRVTGGAGCRLLDEDRAGGPTGHGSGRGSAPDAHRAAPFPGHRR